MREMQFSNWLGLNRGLRPQTVNSRINNCKRIEEFEGALDAQYDKDRLAGLIERLTYSREDDQYNKPQRHKVPIDGNIYNGSATLKSAAILYRDFRRDGGDAAGAERRPEEPRPRKRRTRGSAASWPDWPQPDEEDLLDLARAMAPSVRFLDPRIVAAVAEDNRRRRAEWSARLEALGIDPAIYLWDGSPCAFPGVRRYAGSTEIAAFRGRADPGDHPEHCLSLDDNDYPKHLWAFVFTAKPFRKRGPEGYQLAHLLDHKDHKNRWREELDLPEGAAAPAPLYGLYTSAANAVYLPAGFLRPTDFARRPRSLVQRRAQRLYGDACRLVPPPLAIRPDDDPNWDVGNFRWSAPVGGTDRVPDFLEFRRARIEDLFDKRTADPAAAP